VTALLKPQQLEAERACLHGFLSDPDLFYDQSMVLKPDMFFGIDNASVYKVFLEVMEDNKIPDVVLIKNRLLERNEYDAIGGDAYFELLVATSYVSSNMSAYIKLINDSHLSREIINVGNKIVDAGYTKSAEDSMEVLFSESSRLLNIDNYGSDVLSVSEVMSEEFARFLERIENPGASGIPTMFNEYDLLTGGLYGTDEIIIAARPSVGKTAVALRFMLNLAKQGIPTILFSYEMSQNQIMQRLLSMESKVQHHSIKTGMVTPEQYDKVASAANFIGKLPIYFNADPSASLTEVISTSKKMIRKKGIKVVILDYLQLMPHRVEFATQDLGRITRGLKTLALGTDLNVMVLSQLNRLVEGRQNKEPILSDLRQSGNIEEHADVVLMLSREEIYKPTPENKGITKLLIRKNRNGPIGVLNMMFNPSIVDFSFGFGGG